MTKLITWMSIFSNTTMGTECGWTHKRHRASARHCSLHWPSLCLCVTEALPATFSQSTEQLWRVSKTPDETQQWSDQTRDHNRVQMEALDRCCTNQDKFDFRCAAWSFISFGFNFDSIRKGCVVISGHYKRKRPLFLWVLCLLKQIHLKSVKNVLCRIKRER